jgi:SAM-dependent methyltransferase
VPVPIVDKATLARSFGQVADVYDRGRPGWPAVAIEWTLGPEPFDVLDLGAGTGKLTAALLAAGHRVTALEPSAEMRAVLVERVAEGDRTMAEATAGEAPAPGEGEPAVTVLDGRAEEIPLADGSVDAVVAGSAFHWFDRGPALAEVARVLRPPGTFGLLGNRFDTSVDWQRRLRDRGGSGGGRISSRGHWPSPEELGERFAEVVDAPAFPHRVAVDRAAIREYVASTSRVSTLAPDAREALLAGVDRLWDEDPELRGRESTELLWRAVVRRARGLREG